MKKINYLALTLLLIATPLTSHSFNLSDSWIGEPFSQFKKYRATKGSQYMISSADERASQAGQEIIELGGNAVDAAIATQLVLNVVEPHSSGIGGGGFLLFYDAKNNKTIYFNGRETAPKKAFSKMFLTKDGAPKKFKDAVKGGLSVGTPGLLMALKEAHQQYGKLPWQQLFLPAIKIANEGFEIDERTNILAQKIDYLQHFKQSKELYLNADNTPKKAGSIVKNPQLAQTLQIISHQGIKPFYQGQIAKDIVATVQNSKINPGLLSLSDLQDYKIVSSDLICSNYHQYKVCSMPLPSSGGITVLQILSILENFDLAKMNPKSADTIHLILEATKLAYADRNEYIADSKNVPIKEMLDKKYLQKRSQLIDRKKAATNVQPGKFKRYKTLSQRNMILDKEAWQSPSTTHISVIDNDGNAVALTSSIEYFFGSAISVRGFMLNNQMTDFSFLPYKDGKLVANRVRPGKSPRSSMSPVLVFDSNDELIMTIGSPGGPRIIQFLVKAIIQHLDYDYNIQKAISSPNFIVLNDKVELEARTKLTKLKSQLEKFGHKVTIKDIVSGINGATKHGKSLQGGADPRRQGAAIGK